MTGSALPRLVVVTDWGMGEEALLRAVREVCALGPQVAVQHRNPGALGRVFLRQARALAEVCGPAGVPLLVNGRVDVALLVGAHVHLPSSGPDVADVRAVLPVERWISAAVHDEAEASRAQGATFALVSPVWPAGSKPGDTRRPLGVEGFRALARRVGCPAFALGGVTAQRARELPRLETAGVAVVSAVLKAAEPARAARELLSALPA